MTLGEQLQCISSCIISRDDLQRQTRTVVLLLFLESIIRPYDTVKLPSIEHLFLFINKGGNSLSGNEYVAKRPVILKKKITDDGTSKASNIHFGT